MTRRITAFVLVALTTLAVNVKGQTKESPLLLYRGDYDGPMPRNTKTVVPEYPRTARAGSMILQLTIRPDGKVDAIKPIRPLQGATDAAIAAIKQWKYQPVVFKGKPAWAVIDIRLSNPWGSPHTGDPMKAARKTQASASSSLLPKDCCIGVDDGVRTRDFRSHSPALYR